MAGTGVGKFSSTAGSNTSNMTVNFAENMAPSNVNNAARELMGHMRDMYEQLGDGYFEFGDGDGTYTVTRGDADTITITTSSDLSSVYFVGRKIRITDGGANVVEGTIAASSHSSTTQTIDLTGISLASGTPTKVEIGIDTAAFGGRVILDDDGDTYIEAPTDDTIDIYVAGAKDFNFTANSFGVLTGSSISMVDSAKIKLGTGDDLQIYHDGSNSFVEDAGTGRLTLISNGLGIQFNADGEQMADFIKDGAVELFHNNVKKFETASTGVDITGAITATAASTITTADNTNTLSLVSTDADANAGPNLRLYRNSGSPADDDILGNIDFSGRNDNSEDIKYGYIEMNITDASDGSEDGYMSFNIMQGGANNPFFQMKTGATPVLVINENSKDMDFRVESNSHTHMLFVDGGNNRVGVKLEPDLGDGLHIKTADSGASSNANFDELVIEGSSASGLCILTPNDQTGGIAFGDNNDNDRGRIAYDHSNDRLFIDTNGNDAPCFFFNNGSFATNGETAPDTDQGGICLDQNAGDSKILTFKSSDVAHGMTGSAETDTYAVFQKQSATKGGLQIRAFAEDNPNERINIDAQGDGDITTTKSASGKGAICFISSNKSGTGQAGVNSDANLLTIANYTSTRFIFDAEGTFHSDVGTATYDEYDDAQLVRAMDLSTSTKGLIASKFDDFVKYNHEDLANAKIVGREEDGTPNSMVNWTAMSQLHNGAIWQQYEKTQRLTNAMYELAKAAVGEEKANEILEQNEIKLLN